MSFCLGGTEIARECFEEASQLDPSNLAIQTNVTVCMFYQGKLKEVCPNTASSCASGSWGGGGGGGALQYRKPQICKLTGGILVLVTECVLDNFFFSKLAISYA